MEIQQEIKVEPSDPRTAENARRRGRGQLQNWESGRPAKRVKGPFAELGFRPEKSISSGWRWKMIK